MEPPARLQPHLQYSIPIMLRLRLPVLHDHQPLPLAVVRPLIPLTTHTPHTSHTSRSPDSPLTPHIPQTSGAAPLKQSRRRYISIIIIIIYYYYYYYYYTYTNDTYDIWQYLTEKCLAWMLEITATYGRHVNMLLTCYILQYETDSCWSWSHWQGSSGDGRNFREPKEGIIT